MNVWERQVIEARAEVERLRPLAYGRVCGGRHITFFLFAVRDLVRAEYAAGLLR